VVTARFTTATACCPHFNSRRDDPAVLQQRRVEGRKRSMKRFIDFDQIAA
jgi:hypothetical protein